MSRHPALTTTALIACAALAAPCPARADESVEEIVVSGYRVEDDRNVGASIAVLGAKTVREAAVQHFEELTHHVPNLNWAGGASRPRYFQIRGIGERSQYEGAPNPSVGFIFDDLDFSGLGGLATLYDVEQIEVLRGPQGTRFGANALAGLIYVKTRDPGDEPTAQVTASVGDDDARALGAVLGGPLGTRSAYRAVVHRHRADGFRDNAFLRRDDTNGRDELTARLKLRHRFGDAWQMDVMALLVDLDNGYDAFAVDNGLTTHSDRPGRDTQRTRGAVLELRGDLGSGVSLSSLTGAARSDVVFSFDADWGNAQFWAPYVYDFFSETARDRQQLSQELRLQGSAGAIDWLAGASVANLVESNHTRDDGNFEGDLFASDIAREYEASSTALFVDAQFALGAGTLLSAGVRGERRDARYVDSAGDRFDPDERSVGGRIAISHALDDARTVYARVARGYKAGGFNLGLPADAGDDILLFDAEYLWNYEAGIKGRWLDGRLALKASAFWMQRRDQQVQTSTQLDPNNPATFVFFTDNAGKGRNRGIELSADWLASDRLGLYANVGLLDTRIDDFGASDAIDGREQAHAPGYSYALGGRLGWRDGWYARLDVTGKDAFYFSDSHDRQSRAYTLVNARIGVDRERWSVSAYARNLFDERYSVRGFYFGNEPARGFADTLYVRLGDPRQLGVRADWRFSH